MQLFYEPDVLQTQLLSEGESKHCIKVLRKKSGDVINIIDGLGNLIKAEIVDPNPKKCALKIVEVQDNFEQRSYKLHLAIAPTKNMDRIEWCVEKAVEIGIDEITFLRCDNSERTVVKLERVDRIIISAMKQSIKAFKPILNEVTPIKSFLNSCENQVKMIAHLEEGDKKYISDFKNSTADYCLLIGPEGDFSPSEINLAMEEGFKSVSLGQSRLRTETAGVTGVNEVSLLGR